MLNNKDLILNNQGLESSRYFNKKDIPIYFACIITVVLIVFWYDSIYSSETLYRTLTAQDLLNGLTRGRQALVGSLHLAPLPTIFISIIASLPFVPTNELISVVIAAFSGIIFCGYMNWHWRLAGVKSPYRLIGCVAFLLLPPIAESIVSGKTTMLFITFTTIGVCFLVDWLRNQHLRSLAYSGLLFGLGGAIRFQFFLIAFCVLLLILLVVLISRDTGDGKLEGTALVFFTPVLYMILMWIGGNWLLLGHPLFPLRGVLISLDLGEAGGMDLMTGGVEWAAFTLTLMFAGTPVVLGIIAKKLKKTSLITLIVLFTLAVSHFVSYLFFPTFRRQMGDPVDFEAVSIFAGFMESNYPDGTFIVTGYKGYEFSSVVGVDKEDIWLHVMHLEHNKLHSILKDFRGRDVFLIVKGDDLRGNWLDLGLEWREPTANLPENFFFVEKVGPWVVFEVFSPDHIIKSENSSGEAG